jgi:hypothetical protein
MKDAIIPLLAAAALWLVACGGGDSTGPEPTPAANLAAARPENLTVEKIGDGEIWLRWEGQEEGPLYVVYRAQNKGAEVAVDSLFSTSFRDLGLEYEVEYTYYVTSVGGDGRESDPSNVVSGQPFNNLSPQAPRALRAIAHNFSVPASPQAVSVPLAGWSAVSISLDWDLNPESDLSVYKVFRSTSEDFEPGEQYMVAEVTEPHFIDNDVEVGTVYYYRITAVDRGGKESAASQWASDVALVLPELVRPVQGEQTSQTPVFYWKKVNEAKNYRVIVTSSPTSGEVSDMPLVGDTTAVFVGRPLLSGDRAQLESSQVYYWKVIAGTKDSGVENSVSGVASFKIQ